MSSGEFDKIIKENLTDSFLSLLYLRLGIHVIETERLPALKQTTLQREVDFLARVKTTDQQEFILHVEFQSQHESKMVYRMVEYGAILLRKYRIPIRQFVVYLGDKKGITASELPQDQIIKGFELLNIRDLPVAEFLASDAPEMIILGILSDFGTLSAEEVSVGILEKLQHKKLGEAGLRKFITQLEVLSNLRNLNDIVNQSIRAMPITFDIRKSAFYQQGKREGIEKGIEQGIEKGLEQGIEKGLEQGKREIILNMHQNGLTVEQISELAGVSLSLVEKVVSSDRDN